jgi:hypothetical protein
MRTGDLVLLMQDDIYRRGKTEPLSIPVWKYKENGTPTPYRQVLEGQLATVMDWQPQTGAVEVLLADGERWWLLEPRCVSVQEVSDG